MGFISETANVLNETARILNEAVFGDVRNLFSSSRLYDFRLRPIGLVQKNYDFMMLHINRNIGNAEYTYDGYGTPIGQLANPFYNVLTRTPWFYLDNYKNSTSNYIDYIKKTYGAALSVANLNDKNNDLFHISEDASAVGYIDGIIAIDNLNNNGNLLPNVNETGVDTKLGYDGGYYNKETLRNAWVANDDRSSFNNYITKGLSNYLGLTTTNITEKKAYRKMPSPLTGRLTNNSFSPLSDVDSPAYVSNYGHYSDIGSYIGYYNSLNEKSKKYFEQNVYADKKLYFPTVRDNGNTILNGKTYFGRAGISVGHEKIKYQNPTKNIDVTAVDELQIRYIFGTLEEHSNISDSTNGGVYVYTENEYGSSPNITYTSYNSGVKFGRYTSYNTGLTASDLLKKTNEGFKNGEYRTIIARFHTDYDDTESTDTTQTAVSKWGMSHGRNLLKVTPDSSEGYSNPYCRVWTFHHQYHTLKDAIRPFDENYTTERLYNDYNFNAFTADHNDWGNGRERLDEHGVLNRKNGLVNITPIDSTDVSRKVDVRNCMFSIENLAWKDVFSTDAASRDSFQSGGLSPDQKGPFGGRIMWFPPYDLKFNEDITVNWNETNFIGRGEGIYTYTNTVRSGDLAFKLLVDHPSVLDFWENRGKSNSNSVDNTDDPEQQILRFFAGCDMLTAKPMPTPEQEAAVSDDAVPTPSVKEIVFFVFFPNYYTGIVDGYDFAMKYLTNGLGAGMEKAYYHDSNGNCKQRDKATRYNVSYSSIWKGEIGGYEMRPGHGISIVDSQDEDEIKQNDGHIADIKIGEYGNGTDCNEGKTSLYIQKGSPTDKWYERMWYYRVDDKVSKSGKQNYLNRDLLKENYVDNTSFGLNSRYGQKFVADTFSVEDGSMLFSFADVYAAYVDDARNVLVDGNGKKLYDEEENKPKKFRDLIKKYGVESVTCIGMASVQGTTPENEQLKEDRAKVVKDWICNVIGIDNNIVKSFGDKSTKGGTGGVDPGVNKGDDNDIVNKVWRSVKVTINLKMSESDLVQNNLKEQNVDLGNGQNPDIRETNIINQPESYIKVKSKDPVWINGGWVDFNSPASRYNSTSKNSTSFDNFNVKDYAMKSRLVTPGENIANKYFGMKFTGFTYNAETSQFEGGVETIKKERGKDDYKFNLVEFKDNQDSLLGGQLDDYDSNNTKISTRNDNIDKNVATRYDNESKFFSMLEREDPFMHHKISDKIKYFDPAFHSISPEGFNARLTFLQQCTRQGPTIGSSDNYTENNTANNLAFGRPPVCILRIGDFYYTKILIEGLRISFDPLMWDLNQEGIGVMPMICDVNIRFKFIGGSSLAGHITRLQNALSFNYYANTEVYDNRSELAEYDENGNIAKFKPYNPTK